jgi:hypothetical protein
MIAALVKVGVGLCLAAIMKHGAGDQWNPIQTISFWK